MDQSCQARGGLLGPGEHTTDGVLGGNETLLVDGGTANRITVYDDSVITVLSTGTLPGEDYGIEAVNLHDHSHMTFSGGEADRVELDDNSSLLYNGGQINSIMQMHIFSYEPNPIPQEIIIECLPGWSWLTDHAPYSAIVGIKGTFLDGTNFNTMITPSRNLESVPGVTVVEIPEPLTLVLLGLGGLQIRKRKY